MLVNLTNDGWFWGSSELDMHLACGVFRAVECRKPLLIAANTGFSAWIDGDGRIVHKGRAATPDVLLAEVRVDRAAQLVSGATATGRRAMSGGLHRAGAHGPSSASRIVFMGPARAIPNRRHDAPGKCQFYPYTHRTGGKICLTGVYSGRPRRLSPFSMLISVDTAK